jgi:hypothetical protein
MKFIDRPFGLTMIVFIIGASAGAGSTALFQDVRELALALFQARMISPLETVSHLGNIPLFFLIFANNSVPAVLSFAYPFVILRIKWTPPLTAERFLLFLGGYTFAASFLVGFFSLGAPLGTAWVLGGSKMIHSLVYGAALHGPLEFAFVLVCVAEPFRIALLKGEMAAERLSDDFKLLAVAIVGLAASGATEVFLGI